MGSSLLSSIHHWFKVSPSRSLCHIIRIGFGTNQHQAELHNKQPGWGQDFNPGMPVADFVTAAIEGFAAKKETVAIGMAQKVWDDFEEARGQRVRPQWEMTKKALGDAHKV